MGKPVSTQVVEYAYVLNFVVLKNVKVDEVNTVRITITYELKDVDKNPISLKEVEHYIEVEGQQTDAQTQEVVNANFARLVAEDKFELSGYQQGI